MANGMAFGPELAYMETTWWPHYNNRLLAQLPPRCMDSYTEPCRDKLPATFGPVMGGSMAPATVKISHKVLLSFKNRNNYIIS